MPTSFRFGNKTVTLPGAYSRILSGRENPPLNLDYGNVLIIDLNDDIPGGAGINGEHASGKEAIYSFQSLVNFRDFAFSGLWWRAGLHLFTPNGADAGVSTLSVVRPYTTVAPSLTFTATGGGSAGGTFKIDLRDEGTGANGVLDSTNLKSGYAYTVTSGVEDTDKWIFKVWRGAYRGDTTNYLTPVIPYNEIEDVTSIANPDLIAESPEFNNIQDLLDWAGGDEDFAKYFVLDATSSVTGAGTVDSDDVTAVAGFNVAIGGTSTANSGDLDDVLEAIKDENYNFIIAWDDDATPQASADITKVQAFVEQDAEFDPQLHTTDQLGDEDSITGAVATATGLDSDKVVYTFGSIYKESQLSGTNKVLMHPIFHLAYHVGRLAGLPPQVPLTYKAIDIAGVNKKLTVQERTQLLKVGALVTFYDNKVNDFVVLQDVNTLQNNKFTLNQDGTSHVIQFRRIAAQLNAELIINARTLLLSDPSGVNRNTLSANDVKQFVQGYLRRRIATTNADNLIISFKNVTVTRNQDAYSVTYEFEPNSEIRIIFFTGFAL